MENEPLMDDALKAALSPLYQAADRHYHNLAHIEALLALAARYRALLGDPEAVEAAIWFHDAIYDSKAKDNEAQSAALARSKLAGRANPTRLGRITAMIAATATHEPPDLDDDAALRDAALFLDMDLSILGAAPDAFDAYEQAVRTEYDWVEEPMWRAGRGAVLRTFLSRPHVFHTKNFDGASSLRPDGTCHDRWSAWKRAGEGTSAIALCRALPRGATSILGRLLRADIERRTPARFA